MNLPFPKFLWVMELSSRDSYEELTESDRSIYGEIILDATASKYASFDSVISVRFGKLASYRRPGDKSNEVVMKSVAEFYNLNDSMRQYMNNLKMGGDN